MEETLKNIIRDYAKTHGYNDESTNDLIDAYESEQTFTERKDGSFEMITGNTCADVIKWLQKRKCQECKFYLWDANTQAERCMIKGCYGNSKFIRYTGKEANK